jgi:hypothetical protein
MVIDVVSAFGLVEGERVLIVGGSCAKKRAPSVVKSWPLIDTSRAS